MNLKRFLLILLKGLDRALSTILIYLIKMYRFILSPLFGTNCRFYPSCSKYGIMAVEKYGFFFGVPKIISRILRCNPLNEGGLDPLE